MKLLTSRDFNKNEAQNMRMHQLASAPSSPVEGQLYWDTVAHQMYAWNANASAWQLKATDSALLGGSALATVLARANHTGTQLAATVSDFDTQVRTSRLDQLAAPTASVSLNSRLITNLLDPSGAQDAATKAYVDAARTGLDAKASVRVASTAAVTVTYTATGGTSARGQITAAPNTVDGVSLAAADRILLKDQATGAQNGLYSVTTVGTGANGVWDRATDFDQDAEVTAGAYVWSTEGTANSDKGWVLTTNDPIVIGGASGTSLAFVQFNGTGTSYTGGAGLVLTGAVFDVVAASGSGIIVNADNIDIDPTNGLPLNRGGTGAITAAGARTNLVAMTRATATIGDGSTTAINFTHSMTIDHITVCRDATTGAMVEPDITFAATTDVITFATAPATNAYKLVAIGL